MTDLIAEWDTQTWILTIGGLSLATSLVIIGLKVLWDRPCLKVHLDWEPLEFDSFVSEEGELSTRITITVTAKNRGYHIYKARLVQYLVGQSSVKKPVMEVVNSQRQSGFMHPENAAPRGRTFTAGSSWRQSYHKVLFSEVTEKIEVRLYSENGLEASDTARIDLREWPDAVLKHAGIDPDSWWFSLKSSLRYDVISY